MRELGEIMKHDKLFTELLPNLYFVHGELDGRFPYSNGLMIDSEVKVIVDTGFGHSRIAAIVESGEVEVIRRGKVYLKSNEKYKAYSCERNF